MRLEREGLDVQPRDLDAAAFAMAVRKKKVASVRVESRIQPVVPFEFEDHLCAEMRFLACRDCHVLVLPFQREVLHGPKCNFNSSGVRTRSGRGRP